MAAPQTRPGAHDDRAEMPTTVMAQADEVFDRLVADAMPAAVDAALAAKPPRVYRLVMARVELPLLRHVLALCGGNQLRAARLLGVNRNTLRKRLRLLGLLPTSATNHDGSA